MPIKRDSDYYLRKSHRQLKSCRRLAEHTVQSRNLIVEVCGSLNSVLTAIVLELQEIRVDQAKNKTAGDQCRPHKPGGGD